MGEMNGMGAPPLQSYVGNYLGTVADPNGGSPLAKFKVHGPNGDYNGNFAEGELERMTGNDRATLPGNFLGPDPADAKKALDQVKAGIVTLPPDPTDAFQSVDPQGHGRVVRPQAPGNH